MTSFSLLHTADWHLGHTLGGHARGAEHARFLHWLEETIVTRELDALVVAGDVFDARTPPASAQALLYGFLASVRARQPSLEVVLLAGNHDSPSRLAAPAPLLAPLGVRVVAAAAPRAPASDLVVPLRRRGELFGAVAAIPYLRPSDLANVGDGLDVARVVGATALLHAEVGRAARAIAGSSRAVVGMGHGELRGSVLSPCSERTVAGGGASALSATQLSPEAAYVALGHLHFPQALPGAAHARYSGSPFPLALEEAAYAHSVTVATLSGSALLGIEVLAVPRTVDIVRIPAEGECTLDAALAALAALPHSGEPSRDEGAAGAADVESWPFVEVHVRVQESQRGLRASIEASLAGRRARLARIRVTQPTGSTPAPRVSLADLDVRELVLRKWQAEQGTDLPADVSSALDEVVAAALAAAGDEEARGSSARTSRGETE